MSRPFLTLLPFLALFALFTIAFLLFPTRAATPSIPPVRLSPPGAPAFGLLLSASTPTPLLPLGSPLLVTATLTNTTNLPIAIAFMTGSEDITCAATHNGAPCPLTPLGKSTFTRSQAPSAIVLPLAPHASRTTTLPITQLLRMPTPGTYTVTLTREVSSPTAKSWTTLQSLPLLITLLPPP